jgi:outer membrane protein assembly factor BamA
MSPSVRPFHIFLLYGMLATSLVAAQTHRKLTPQELPPSAFKLIAIKVTGSQRFKKEDVIATSGLQIGQTANEDDFKKALRLLGETGAFNDLLYSFDYSAEGTKLTLQVKDADHFVPARFENFVWFSDQDLRDQIHAQVPLFEGDLPQTGNLADQVSNALQGMLIARKVQGQADYLRAAPNGGAIDAFSFSVSGPQIHIRNVAFTGAGSAELPLLENAAKRMHDADYDRSVIRVHEDKDFLPVYLARGYLKATFGDPQPKVVEDNPQETLVDLTFSVEPGRQYKLTNLDLDGSKAFPADRLKQLIHLAPGQPANATQLATDIEAIEKLYGTRGYMAATVTSKTFQRAISSTWAIWKSAASTRRAPHVCRPNGNCRAASPTTPATPGSSSTRPSRKDGYWATGTPTSENP